MPYIHALVHHDGQLLSPCEQPSDWPQTVGYFIPVTGDRLFDEYTVDVSDFKSAITAERVITVRSPGKMPILVIMMYKKRITLVTLSFDRVRYTGKLSHPDFEHDLIEVEIDQSEKNYALETGSMVIVGCNPFDHYKGLTG